jgi:hypothetical protein
MHHHVSVRWPRSALFNDEHSPAHAQVHHQDASGIEVTEQVLSATSRGGDSCTAQPVDDCFATLSAHGSFAEHFDAFDNSAHRAAFDAATHRFYFG